MAKFRKLIALLLVVVMSFSLLGVTGVFADTETEQSSNTYVCPTCGAELTAPDADHYYVCTETPEHTDLTCGFESDHVHEAACYTTIPATYSHELMSYADNSATVTAASWITNKDLGVSQSLSITGRSAAASQLATATSSPDWRL